MLMGQTHASWYNLSMSDAAVHGTKTRPWLTKLRKQMPELSVNVLLFAVLKQLDAENY